MRRMEAFYLGRLSRGLAIVPRFHLVQAMRALCGRRQNKPARIEASGSILAAIDPVTQWWKWGAGLCKSKFHPD